MACRILKKIFTYLVLLIELAAQVGFIGLAGYMAYKIRLYAINDYGRVIHEFDPWFNFRATQYLADHGLYEFFHWFDHRSWYPLGRPVGTTIYPGMQLSAVGIWKLLPKFGLEMSLNDVCVFIPTWYGVAATMFTGLLTWECSGSRNSGVIAALVMSICPAHIMRSVGGGYDNESVAVTAMVMTFFFWCRSLRYQSRKHLVFFGVMTGLSYIYMAATWGGYIFTLNMIGLHAGSLVLVGKFSHKLHIAYSLFYVIGTLGAMQVPVIGWTPLKSMEQLGACIVFLGLQAIAFCEWKRKGKSLWTGAKIYLGVGLLTVTVLGIIVAILLPTGYFGPLSSRVRGLFVRHTRTGNPLVDSVAEHQPASSEAYKQYLGNVRYLAVAGLGISALRWSDSSLFLVAHGLASYFFSTKMARLIMLLGAVSSALAGVLLGTGIDWAVAQFIQFKPEDVTTTPTSEDEKEEGHGEEVESKEKAEEVESKEKAEEDETGKEEDNVKTKTGLRQRKGKGKNEKQGGKGEKSTKKEARTKKSKSKAPKESIFIQLKKVFVQLKSLFASVKSLGKYIFFGVYNFPLVRLMRLVIAIAALVVLFWPTHPRSLVKKLNVPAKYRKMIPKDLKLYGYKLTGYPKEFFDYSHQVAQQSSNPSIMYKARLNDGTEIILDDYREAYWWLKKNTPYDARVMAWWDYGYQISGIGNRTTIADGNTWNHEHIATLGRTLTAPVKVAHRTIRFWADYVLIWTGGGGDDLAKSPHMARIATSVYPDVCPNDPTCRMFGFYQNRQPTPMMAKSLLYRLSMHGQRGQAPVSSKLFQLVYQSKYAKVRIFKVKNVSQKAKKWVADPKNKICDAPGSWYCTGQYPPAMQKLMKKWKRKDFQQVEDWNKKRDADSDKHYKEYMKNMGGK